MEITKTKIQL